MTEYLSYPHQNSKLYYLDKKALKHENEIIEEITKKKYNLRVFKNVNLFLSIIKRIRNLSVDWENLDTLIEDGEIQALYKQWEVPILDTSEDGIASLTSLIIPYITHSIIYESAESNDIDFYDADLNLKQTGFFDIKHESLVLKVSVYIKKYFGSDSLSVPRAKLTVDFRNPLEFMK